MAARTKKRGEHPGSNRGPLANVQQRRYFPKASMIPLHHVRHVTRDLGGFITNILLKWLIRTPFFRIQAVRMSLLSHSLQSGACRAAAYIGRTFPNGRFSRRPNCP